MLKNVTVCRLSKGREFGNLYLSHCIFSKNENPLYPLVHLEGFKSKLSRNIEKHSYILSKKIYLIEKKKTFITQDTTTTKTAYQKLANHQAVSRKTYVAHFPDEISTLLVMDRIIQRGSTRNRQTKMARPILQIIIIPAVVSTLPNHESKHPKTECFSLQRGEGCCELK